MFLLLFEETENICRCSFIYACILCIPMVYVCMYVYIIMYMLLCDLCYLCAFNHVLLCDLCYLCTFHHVLFSTVCPLFCLKSSSSMLYLYTLPTVNKNFLTLLLL